MERPSEQDMAAFDEAGTKLINWLSIRKGTDKA